LTAIFKFYSVLDRKRLSGRLIGRLNFFLEHWLKYMRIRHMYSVDSDMYSDISNNFYQYLYLCLKWIWGANITTLKRQIRNQIHIVDFHIHLHLYSY